MHLVFTSYEGKAEFKIQEKNKTDLDMEMIFDEYSESEYGKENMDLYLSLFEQEVEIAKRRKQLLQDLKEDFKENFIPIIEEKKPEYFISFLLFINICIFKVGIFSGTGIII